MMTLQPFIGLIQHLKYRRTGKARAWNLLHRWYGRVLVLLGMINGGLGIQLANDTTGGKISYSVVAGISGTAFLGLVIWSEIRRSKEKDQDSSDVAMDRLGQAGVKAAGE